MITLPQIISEQQQQQQFVIVQLKNSVTLTSELSYLTVRIM